MVRYSYKDTRLSVFRPAASRNLNPCCSWPQADTGSSLSISTYTQHWDLPGTSGQGRGEQGDLPGSKSANPHPPGHQPTSPCWKSFPFAKYRHTDTLVSTALLSASHYLASCKHAEAKIVSSNSLAKTKDAFFTQTATICRNFFWPCQCQAHGKYHNTWKMGSPSPAEHPSAQETHPPE